MASGSRLRRAKSVAWARLRHLYQLDLVSFRSIDESNAAAILFHMRSVRKLQAERLQMFAEFIKAIDLEREMSQVWLHLHRPAVRKMAKLNQLLTFGRFHKDQL